MTVWCACPRRLRPRNDASELRWQDRLRKLMFITPWLVPLHCLTIGKGYMDGWHGLYYAVQRGVAEAVLSLKLMERKLRGGR